MARKGRKPKKNPAARRANISPSKRTHHRAGPTPEHVRQRIAASGSEHVSNDYALDVLLELRRQDVRENAERGFRGEAPIPQECMRGIDEFQHAAGWNLWRLRWSLQGEIGSLPNSVDKKYARLVAPAEDPEPEQRRELTPDEREDMIVAAKRVYIGKLRALDRIGTRARRVVEAVCLDGQECQMPWKIRFGDKMKLPDWKALILGLEAIGAKELREDYRRNSQSAESAAKEAA